MTTDAAGHAAYLLLICGTALVGTRWANARRLGWFLRACGSLSWCLLGLAMGMSSIWAWSGVFLTIDLRGLTAEIRRAT